MADHLRPEVLRQTRVIEWELPARPLRLILDLTLKCLRRSPIRSIIHDETHAIQEPG